tara:strand:+ start:146 stop:625 length:480 start_codon:yes stop_codon:yes gene_type:complete
MIIREIKDQDNNKIAEIIRKVFVEMKAPKIGTAFSDPELDQLSIAFNGVNSKYFILENNGRVLGGAGINPLKGHEERVCELQKMYFEKNARGKGWGGRMIDVCLNYAINNNYSICYIETMKFMKAAQNLYIKKGFTFINSPMGNTGHTNCDVWMIKKLK